MDDSIWKQPRDNCNPGSYWSDSFHFFTYQASTIGIPIHMRYESCQLKEHCLKLFNGTRWPVCGKGPVLSSEDGSRAALWMTSCQDERSFVGPQMPLNRQSRKELQMMVQDSPQSTSKAFLRNCVRRNVRLSIKVVYNPTIGNGIEIVLDCFIAWHPYC